MTIRRQALRSPATVVASFFFSLILLFFFALPPGTRAVAGDAERVSPGDIAALFVLLLMLLSAATFIVWRYHRREFTSPRRLGRRI